MLFLVTVILNKKGESRMKMVKIALEIYTLISQLLDQIA